MPIIYSFAIKLYGLFIIIASFFSKKAKQWIKGRKHIFKKLKSSVRGRKTIWFHASSFGEFEQGRPVLDSLIREFPNHHFVVTFFSPSAYEHFNTRLNDVSVFYLPLDTPGNANKFLDIVNPEFVVFVKNDFWFNYIRALYKRNIKIYYISCIFRPSQIYFKWFGGYFLRQFKKAEHFFVQNQSSLQLLYKNKVTQVSVSGDTRFDRVYNNLTSNNNIAGIEIFKGEHDILIGGSTWAPEERMLIKLANEKFLNLKIIIAPHEINEHKINTLQKNISVKNVRYSQIDENTLEDARVIIMDNVGFLSSLYKYGKLSIIGGGFGNGIHNILESVTFGVPTFFGPKYKKFKEAVDLVNRKKAFSFKKLTDLKEGLKELYENELIYEDVSETNKNYILENKGATDIIVNQIKMDYELISNE